LTYYIIKKTFSISFKKFQKSFFKRVNKGKNVYVLLLFVNFKAKLNALKKSKMGDNGLIAPLFCFFIAFLFGFWR